MSDIRFTTETQDMTGRVEYQVGVVDGKQRERDRIVEWLRKCKLARVDGRSEDWVLTQLADMLQNGEHWDE